MDPLRTINTRVTPQTEKAVSSQVVNNAGGFVFEVTPEQRLKRFLVLGTDAGSYYESAEKLTRESAEFLIDFIQSSEDNARTAQAIIESVSIRGTAPKQNATIFAYAIVVSLAAPAVRAEALAAFNNIIRTGTHLFMFMNYVEQFRGHGRALNRALKDWYLSHDDGNAYQVVKYRSREGWSHADVLRKAKPKPTNPAQLNTFAFATGKRSDFMHNEPIIIEGFRMAQNASDERVTAALVKTYGLSWEMLKTEHLNSVPVWDALLDNGMPLGALTRQLPRLTNLGIIGRLGKGRTDEIVDSLTDHEELRKARVHPVKMLIAEKTYASGQGKSQSWTPVPAIINALDEAFYVAFDFYEPAGKRTLVGLDVSGSMGGGYSLNAGDLKPVEVGAALSMTFLRTEPHAEVFGFADEFRELGITKRSTLREATANAIKSNFGRTDASLAIQYAAAEDLEVDTFVVITDNETYAGRIHPFQALRQYRSQTGISAKLVVLATTATSFTIADPSDAGMLDIAGFGADVPQLVTEFSRGF